MTTDEVSSDSLSRVGDLVFEKSYWLEREKQADEKLKRICGGEYRSRLIRSELLRLRSVETFLKPQQLEMSHRNYVLETLRLVGNEKAEDWTHTLSPERLAAREFVVAKQMSILVTRSQVGVSRVGASKRKIKKRKDLYSPATPP